MANDYQYTEYINLLEANKNLILTGAPGTGKTYLAKKIAEAMNAEYEFVQFHPSYDYTDFVEGLRPTPPDRNGNIGFERKDGVFKEFCKKSILLEITNDKESFPRSTISHSNSLIINHENIIEQAMVWLMKQNGATLYSIRGRHTKYKLILSDNKIFLEIPNGNKNSVNPQGIKRYLENGHFDEKHQTYEPAVGNFIIQNCPLYKGSNNNSNSSIPHSINHKDILTDKTNPPSINIKLNRKFIFIIDEINRGELSKIFGELFFSIDPGYRGKRGLVKTQYQNLITDKSDPFYEGFYVPENVYIIGTMNDIDRSVESMDFAMRRRFAWKEVKANENTNMLDDLGNLKAEVVEKMRQLNNAIWNEKNNDGIEGLSSAYHIGGAYFRKLKLYLNDEQNNPKEAYKKLWENHLKGVLFEYLRGSLNASENMNMLEEIYYSENIKA